MLRILLATSIFSTSLFSLLLPQSAAASDVQSGELCLIPVEDGQPTQQDIGETWRMVSRFLAFDGISRPIVYAMNRGGVWTIDESNRFIRFGGEFPRNLVHDSYAADPSTGNVIGINSSEGVFMIRAGGTQFTPLYAADDGPLQAPHAVTYVPRLGGFVVSDRTGIYLLDSQLRLTDLPLDAVGRPGKVFDLPEFSALILNPREKVFLRDDSGHTVLLATLEEWDYVVKVGRSRDGKIHIKTYWNEFTVSPPGKDASGRFSPVEDAHIVRQRPAPTKVPKLHPGPEIGENRFAWRSSGLWRQHEEASIPFELPFDAAHVELTDVQEYPPDQNLVLFSSAGIFTLEPQGAWKLIPRSKELTGRVTSQGAMPNSRGLLVSSTEGLYLLAPATKSNAGSCLQ
ncbi:hypothetical protein [Mycoplana rhizolycopersici]|uniref:Uncharacterized protein n=1 Tax=Mycoplana rhizolycopersici TaxID=2746702 RepID=A0ABX2QLT2_9HYPH|nr:hypothetical protein [Rhizobium rhizolycopersici]NVP57857.1 hypothetical protein [Rhizobium rhizolycopersici]